MQQHAGSPTITFIGGGNMAAAMVNGLVAHQYPPEAIIVVDKNEEKVASMAERFGVRVGATARDAVEQAHIVVIAVKPQGVGAVVSDIATIPGFSHKLFVSTAAGIRLSFLEATLGSSTAIIRAMPNTPALIGRGVTAIYANAHTNKEQVALATRIMESFGICLPVGEEDRLDAVTAISGSGPAYFFLLMEEMIRAGGRVGLTEQEAVRLTLQTALGAAAMAAQGDDMPSELRKRVTSPSGTTQCAIESMQRDGFGTLVERAVQGAHRRAVELGMSSESAAQ